MDYESAIDFIHSMRHGGPDFARMRAVLDALGGPDRDLKIIHVAGTNGKGSVCAYIDSVLRAAGYSVGLFTSPYVSRFNERIRVDGKDIPDGDLAEITERVKSVLERLDAHPAEFELVTVLGLEYFRACQVDFAVVEVGMGGVHDATNVVERTELSVITSIGLDHTQYLGGTLEEIAGVKAGIIREHGRCVAYADPGGVIGRRCSELGAKLVKTDFDRLKIRSLGLEGAEFDFEGLSGLIIPLAGEYQTKNAALAVTALWELADMGWNIPGESIRAGLAAVNWPGRLEILRHRPLIVMDGGHNPPATRALAGSLRRLLSGKKVTFLLGVMRDKDVSGILDGLEDAAEGFVCVMARVPRAMESEELAKLIAGRGFPAVSAGSIAEGVRLAASMAGPEGCVCAAGSLYILEDVRRAVRTLYPGN